LKIYYQSNSPVKYLSGEAFGHNKNLHEKSNKTEVRFDCTCLNYFYLPRALLLVNAFSFKIKKEISELISGQLDIMIYVTDFFPGVDYLP
jgi:hypothetical protein